MRPTVEQLESRCNPAPLLALSAAQLASLHDAAGVSDDVADVGQVVQIPAANAVIRLKAADTDMGCNVLAVIRDGVLVDSHWTGGAAPELYASAFAQAEQLPLFDVTLDLSLDGQLPADASFVSDLLDASVGDVFTDVELAAALDVLPATLAEPGSPLQLAVAVEGGWQVHTLTLTTQYGEPAWTLDESVFAETLTPALGLWELRIAG